MLNEIKRIFDLKPKEKEMGFVEKISTIVKQRKKINTLEIELFSLKEQIKSDAYKKVIERLDDPLCLVRLKKENKTLRGKIEVLKNELSKKQ